MKNAFLVLSFIFSTAVFAEAANKAKTIIVEEAPGRLREAPELVVETGTAKISGTPDDRMKMAMRSWEDRCKEWKMELRSMNGRNLLVADCGSPVRSEEMVQSEKQYTYSSNGSYKIKVLGK